MSRNVSEAHACENRFEHAHFRRAEFDKFKAIKTDGVFKQIGHVSSSRQPKWFRLKLSNPKSSDCQSVPSPVSPAPLVLPRDQGSRAILRPRSSCITASSAPKIGRAHGRTPVTNAHLVDRLLLETK